MNNKVFWVMRMTLINLLKGQFKIGYFGRPNFLFGLRKINFGKNVGIFPGARLEVLGSGRISIGEFTRIGHSFFASTTDSEIKIGKNCIFSGNVFIGTHKYDFKKPRLNNNWFNHVNEKSVIVGDNCFVGMNAVILPGAEIGDNCTIGANTVVSGKVNQASVIRK